MIDSGNGGLYYLTKIRKEENSYILIMDKSFFPYGDKSIEFLLKRSFYLCLILDKKVDKIILACNTLSLIALPFLKQFFSNIRGVFYEFIPYIHKRSVILGSSRTITLLKDTYPYCMDGTRLISLIEKKEETKEEIHRLNSMISSFDNIILACTHFIGLKENSFCIPEIKNGMNST